MPTEPSPLPSGLLQTLLRQTDDLVLILRPDGTIEHSFGAHNFGYAEDEVVGMNCFSFVLPEDEPSARAFFDSILEGESGRLLECRIYRPGGDLTWCEVSGSYSTDEEGRDGVLLVVRDTDDRRRSEDRAREHERRYRLLIDQAPLGIVTTDLDLNIVSANGAYADIVGAPNVDVLIGRSIMRSPGIRGREAAGDRIRVGETIQSPIFYESVFGKQVDCRVTISPLRGDDGTPVGAQMLFEDTSQSRRLEDDLRQAQKMQAVGRLAGGVAHDFNNNLTVILGMADQLAADGNLDSETRARATEIVNAAERSASLTAQLLAFSRPKATQLGPMNPGMVLAGLEPFLRRVIGESVDLRCVIDADAPLILGDSQLFVQVLLNLAVNARDAMQGAGVLRISVQTDGDDVEVEVTDTGSGFSGDEIASAFEPFFTTKGVGEGTGLGLTAAYSIVQQFQGTIEIDADVEAGARLVMRFPVIEAEVSAPDPEPHTTEEPAGDVPACLLVMEDEPIIRSFMCEALRDRGYLVHEAATGPEALDVAAAIVDEIDLFISDVRVPGLSGPETVAELQKSRPDLPVLYVSGFHDTLLQRDSTDAGIDLLPKPFTMDQLLTRVRARLDQSRAVART